MAKVGKRIETKEDEKNLNLSTIWIMNEWLVNVRYSSLFHSNVSSHICVSIMISKCLLGRVALREIMLWNHFYCRLFHRLWIQHVTVIKTHYIYEIFHLLARINQERTRKQLKAFNGVLWFQRWEKIISL